MRGQDSAASGGTVAGYQPGLDGLRALCLFGVLLFHSDVAWMSGGFLGVSTFFTLSGYLITSLLVAEIRRAGRVSLSAFWERRLRRLAPAAILAVAAVVAAAPIWLPLAQRERLAGDALAALAYLVNWRFVRADYAYALIFVDPSPLQHFWSLAIEAQFYLVYPLFVGLLLRPGRGTFTLGVSLASLAAVSVGLSLLPAIAGNGTDRIYYGSDTRAAELLVGGLGGLYGARIPDGLVRWLAPAALAAILAIWSAATIDDVWLYHGGFAAYALLSLAVVLGATRPTLVRACLDPAWLRWVGRVSYGGYVYHWPVFLLLPGSRLGLAPWPTFVLRVFVTLALAGVSARWVEEPIRRGRVLRGRSFWATMGAATAAVVGCAVVLDPGSVVDQVAIEIDGDREEVVGGARRWAAFGDSTALSIAVGMRQFAAATPGVARAAGDARLGCGLLDEGRFFNRGAWSEVADECRDAPGRWAEVVRRSRIDVAIVLVGAWESRDWRLPGVRGDLSLGHPVLDAAIRARVEAAMDSLREAGALVVWLTAPHLGVPDKALPRHLAALRLAAQPERQDRLNEIIRDAAAGRDDVVVVDLAEMVRAWPGGEFDRTLRPDSTHFGRDGSIRLFAEVLGPEILGATRARAR